MDSTDHQSCPFLSVPIRVIRGQLNYSYIAMISRVFGFLLAMYFLVGRWSIDRLDGTLDDESVLQQPRTWIVALLVVWAVLAISGRAKKSAGKALTSVDAAICLFLG